MTILGVVGVLMLSGKAGAQGVGFQTGGTVDPEQVYVGSHVEFPLGSDQFILRPGIDGGFGSNLTIASINVEFLYRFDLGDSGWKLYQGGGPVIGILRFTDPFLREEVTDVGGGVSYVFGFVHQGGFFTEFKGGGGSGSPNLKFGVGFTVRTD